VAEESYDPALFERLARAEPRSFWFRSRNRLIVATLRRYFPQFESLLEVGCGNGFVLSGIRAAFPRTRLVGVDLFEQGLVIARERVPDADLRLVDAENLAFDERFDVVCAFDVLEHLDDDFGAVVQMSGVVKQRGGLVLLVPQHRWLWSGADVFAHHRRRYRRTELAALVERAGFEVVWTTSFTAILLPLMLASRWRQRVLRREYNIWQELDPGLLNRPFEWLLGVERKLIERGVSLPVGGSLLLVARRAT
jgi:SAM-dependent methyltransferase